MARAAAYCALTAREEAVLNLWDAGHSVERIAEQLGRGLNDCRRIVVAYDVSQSVGRAYERQCRRSNAAYLDAIARTGKQFR